MILHFSGTGNSLAIDRQIDDSNAVWSVRRMLREKGVSVSYCNKIRVPDSSALAFGRNPNNQKNLSLC